MSANEVTANNNPEVSINFNNESDQLLATKASVQVTKEPATKASANIIKESATRASEMCITEENGGYFSRSKTLKDKKAVTGFSGVTVNYNPEVPINLNNESDQLLDTKASLHVTKKTATKASANIIKESATRASEMSITEENHGHFSRFKTLKDEKAVTGFTYLTCLSTNVDGLLSKFAELKDRITQQQPDVVGVVETALQLDEQSDKYCPDDFLEIEGYQMIRQDNATERKGGILLYIRDEIKVTENKVINNLSADFKESKWVELEVSGTKVIFGTVYRKGKSTALNNKRLSNLIERHPRCIKKY